jgi:predicted peptidase
MQKYFIALLFLGLAQFCRSQDFSAYQKLQFVDGNDTLPYRLLLPQNYDGKKKYPLVLFLHGRGESGTDNELQLTHGAKLFLRDSIRKKYPAIIVFPQCRSSSYWSNVDIKEDSTGKRVFNFSPKGEPTKDLSLTEKLLKQLQHDLLVNKKQMYVMGLSMGGMGTFEMVRRHPKMFAAAIPICGGANASTAKQLRKTNWWIFHGAKDDVVNPDFSVQMAAALRKQRTNVQFTLYPDANHNSWDPAFAEPTFLNWLFSNKK